ncbi:GNAT family protein [soil metagenome]
MTDPINQPIGDPVPGWTGATVPARAVVQGRYCQLQPLGPQHAAALWSAIEGHADLWTYLPDGPFADGGGFARWIGEKAADPDSQFSAICDPEGVALGVASYLRIDPAHGSIEIGNLLFSPRLRRTRAATEAMALAMGVAFAHGFRRYEWKCHALNHPSRSAALRLGFTYEGTFRNACVVKGRNRDTAWFSVTAAEWPALRTAFGQWLEPANFDAEGHQIARLGSFRASCRDGRR